MIAVDPTTHSPEKSVFRSALCDSDASVEKQTLYNLSTIESIDITSALRIRNVRPESVTEDPTEVWRRSRVTWGRMRWEGRGEASGTGPRAPSGPAATGGDGALSE